MGVLIGDATGDAAGEATGEDSTELRTDDMAEDSVSSSNMKLRGLAAFAIVGYLLYFQRDAIVSILFAFGVGFTAAAASIGYLLNYIHCQGNSTDIMITFIFFHMNKKKGGG